MKYKVIPSKNELVMNDSDFIVSKTDTKGIITYANRIFIKFARYTENELLGKQHNIIRHPDMPRAVFELLWKTIKNGDEIFAFVKNLAKDGSFYWVYANISPVYDANRKLVGYYSVRRKPNRKGVNLCIELYQQMIDIEKHIGKKSGMKDSLKYLTGILDRKNTTYEKFVYALQNGENYLLDV